jgi:transcriptional regulator
MYVPKHFCEEDLVVLQTLMRDYSFATLVSVQADGLPVATHLPFIFEPDPAPYGTLKAHIALGNPQWQTFQEERDALVIFQGPHTYISPSWYEIELSVPTWNYATVHAYGRPSIITDQEEIYKHLKELIETHESQFAKPWLFQPPKDYLESRLKGIVVFSLPITRLEGKFKMSQNRSIRDRENVIKELRSANNSTACEVAALIQARI